MNKDEEKIIVKLDAKQHSWLLQRVSYEFDEELRYQSRNDFVDTGYELHDACLNAMRVAREELEMGDKENFQYRTECSFLGETNHAYLGLLPFQDFGYVV